MKSELPVFGSTDELILGILRRWFKDHPEIHIGSLFSTDMHPPFIIARRDDSGTPGSSHDENHLRAVLVSISVVTEGLEAERDGEYLQEAIHHAIQTAVREQWVIPGHGSISRVKTRSPYARKSDWQSSTNLVQYASLPKEWVRMEAVWLFMLRPPRPGTNENPFISPAK